MAMSAAFGIKSGGNLAWSYAHSGGEPCFGSRYDDVAHRIRRAYPGPALSERVASLRMLPLDAEPSDADRTLYADYADYDVNGGRGYYALLRNLQGDVEAQLRLGVMLDARSGGYVNFGWLADYDAGTLACIQGFNPAKETLQDAAVIFSASMSRLTTREFVRRFARDPNWL